MSFSDDEDVSDAELYDMIDAALLSENDDDAASQHSHQEATDSSQLEEDAKVCCCEEVGATDSTQLQEAANVGCCEEKGERTMNKSGKRKREAEYSEVKCKRNELHVEESKTGHFIHTGPLSMLPEGVFFHIFKFLSANDLANCASVCRFMNAATSDELLWLRLFKRRWPLPPPNKSGNLRVSSWKELYFKQDSKDVKEGLQDCDPNLRDMYGNMYAACRNQTLSPSEIKDDLSVPDITLEEQIRKWRRNYGFSATLENNHQCSGRTCTYDEAGDAFFCTKTGFVHVCDLTCREAIYDEENQNLVCPISGFCTSAVMEDDPHQGENHDSDEMEPFTGNWQMGHAYIAGYNCHDEKELDNAIRQLLYPGSNGNEYKSSLCS